MLGAYERRSEGEGGTRKEKLRKRSAAICSQRRMHLMEKKQLKPRLLPVQPGVWVVQGDTSSAAGARYPPDARELFTHAHSSDLSPRASDQDWAGVRHDPL